MEHRQGLAVDVEITEATGYAEREAAVKMLARQGSRTGERWRRTKPTIPAFVADCRELVTPHVAHR